MSLIVLKILEEKVDVGTLQGLQDNFIMRENSIAVVLTTDKPQRLQGQFQETKKEDTDFLTDVDIICVFPAAAYGTSLQ